VLHVLCLQHNEYWHDKQVVVAAVAKDGRALKYAPKQFKQDAEVVLAAVNRAGWLLQYAHHDMQANFDVVFAAATQDGTAIRHASYALQRNKQIVLAALKTFSYALTAFNADELWNDKEFVLAAVNSDGRMLIHAPPLLRADKDVVLAACTQNLRAMKYANSYESLSFSSQGSFVQETSLQQSFGQGPLTDRAVLQQLVQRWGQKRVGSTAKDTLIADQAAQVCELLKTFN
jgi:predicted  nucleic acid-binding Zn-ribbon protein